MSNYTPGPWQSDSKKLVIRRGQGSKMGFAREAREDCYLVETANGGHRHIAFVRNKIDARAIAAAPEMLELLKEARNEFLEADYDAPVVDSIEELLFHIGGEGALEDE